MPPKKKTGPPRGGARPAAGRGSGPAPGGGRPLAGNAAASDAGVDIVFSKAKPRAKGHKQRGAGTVMSDPGSVERDGITVLSWQRLPSQLIQQHADRLHLKAPRYQAVKPSEPGLFCFQIIIPDRKNSAKDLSFLPTVSFSTMAQAKEHAALLALVKLQEDQPLERKLPEPYKTTWLQSVAEAKGEGQRPLARWEKAKKAREDKAALEEQAKIAAAQAKAASLGQLHAGDAEAEEELKKKSEAIRKAKEKPAAVVLKAHNEFMSKFDEKKSKEEKERKVKDAQRKKEAWARSNSDMKVMMNARLRRLLEEALGLTEERERHREGGAEHHGLTLDELDVCERAVLARIQGMGFPADDVLRAMAACPGEKTSEEDNLATKTTPIPAPTFTSSTVVSRRADTLLEWLCLHLAEHELPDGFDPRGKMLDVIRPGKKKPEATTTITTITTTTTTAVERGDDSGSTTQDLTTEAKILGVSSDPGAEAAAAAEYDTVIGALELRLLEYGFGYAEMENAVNKGAKRDVEEQVPQAAVAAAAEAAASGGKERYSNTPAALMLRPLGVLAAGLAAEVDFAELGVRGGGGGGNQTDDEAQEAVDEEVLSLEAIYGDDVVVSPHMPKGSHLLTFDLRTLASMPTETWLDVWILRAGAGQGGYPGEAAPIALVREGGRNVTTAAAAAAGLTHLRAAQVALARRAASLVGNTAVYDLLVWAIEELPGILSSQSDGPIAAAAGESAGAISSLVISSVSVSSSGGDHATRDKASTTGAAESPVAVTAKTTVSGRGVAGGLSGGSTMPLIRLAGASEPLFAPSS